MARVVRLLSKTIMLAGDVQGLDGRGGHSSFGHRFFDDENFVLKCGPEPVPRAACHA